LYNIIGTTYGAGSTGEFKLPDLRDRFARGANSNLGTTGGNATASLNVGNLPPHTHPIDDDGVHSHALGNNDIAMAGETGHHTGNTAVEFGFGTPNATQTSGNHNHGGATGSAGSGDPVNILNPFLAITYIIRVI
jgi:microcystin-dependent protein